MMTAGLEAELAARRAVVAAANAPGIMSMPKPCPHCGQLMPASTPAADPPPLPPAYDASGDRGVVLPAPAPDTNIANEPPPSGYMSRKKLL